MKRIQYSDTCVPEERKKNTCREEHGMLDRADENSTEQFDQHKTDESGAESLAKTKADKNTVERLYEQLMEISRQTFEKGLYEASYHSLVSAMYAAKDLGSDKHLSMIAQRANEQKWWFDNYAPEHPLSSASALLQGEESMYTQLAEKAVIERRKLVWDRKWIKLHP
jgi:hypothetical protein